jgi:hypothetical protein
MRLILFLSFLFPIVAISQSVFVPLNKEYNHLIDRQEILSGKTSNDLHTSFKPYSRENVYKMTSHATEDSLQAVSKVDAFNQQYLKDDNWEWADSSEKVGNSKRGIFKLFYQKKNALYSYKGTDFEVQATPVFYFMGGREAEGVGSNYINTRGAEIRGMIDKKIGFYSVISTTQALYPNYVRERINLAGIRAVPGEGYFKPYQAYGVDFFTARGYFTFNFTKHIKFQFGQDRNFIGNGHRSLILSDFTSPYLFGKIQTKIWKIHYTNLYAQTFYNTNIGKDTTYPRKFMTLHHLSMNIGKHLNVGVFESIVYTRENNQFDFNYLNPIIFYRYVETYMGSSDKATIGADFKLNFLKHLSLYGQIVLNEFRIREIRNGNGWWGNKQAYQLGLKYINVAGVNNLDMQLEANVVRPFTYTSLDGTTNYSAYNQPLAHPMGANFVEIVGLLRCQPFKRINIVAKAIATRIGLDDAKNNYGSNIFIPYTRAIVERPYGNYITQGVTTNIAYAEMTLSYMARHNLFLDLSAMAREQFTENANARNRKNTYFASFGLRYNFNPRTHEF